MSETYRTIQGEIKLLQQDNEFLFPVELWLLNDELTRNGWRFDNLAEHREQWAGVPILVAYVNGGRVTGDGHNQTTRVDKNGQEYQSFTDATAERICGSLSDNPDDIRIEERDGVSWVVGRGLLWAWYSHELVMQIADWARQGRTMSLSIEALVTDSYMDGDIEVETSYRPLGATLLGAGVAPAVPGAHVAMLSELESEFKELKLRAASYQNQANAEENKPKNNPNQKGMTKRMKFSKQQLRELQAKFGDYTVLAAEQGENGVLVGLMSKAGETAIYKMASADEAVYLDKVQVVNAQTHFCADGCDDLVIDACDLTELASENAKECLDRAECAEKELKECKAEMERMVNAENARRVKAAQKAAEDALDQFNKDREEKVSADTLKALSADIEAGKFTALCDANGVWNGDEAVTEKVLALCAKADMEYQKKLAEKRSDPQPLNWGNVRQMSAAPGTVGELLASKN